MYCLSRNVVTAGVCQNYSERQQWLLQANVISGFALKWPISGNLCSCGAPCICRQVVVCCSPFIICCLMLYSENVCKQLKPTCSYLEQLKLCLCCNLKHLSHLNCLCDPLHEKHCNYVAKLQCEVDWPWLQLIVDCGEAVTILGDCVVWSNSIVNEMTWCGAVCSYHSSFVEGCIRVSVPCEPRSLSADYLVAPILNWVTADVCKGLWVSNGWPVVVACVVATWPEQFCGYVTTEDPNLVEGGRLDDTQM